MRNVPRAISLASAGSSVRILRPATELCPLPTIWRLAERRKAPGRHCGIHRTGDRDRVAVARQLDTVVEFDNGLVCHRAERHMARRIRDGEVPLIPCHHNSTSKEYMHWIAPSEREATYDQPLFAQKCSALFEHVYESCPSSMRESMPQWHEPAQLMSGHRRFSSNTGTRLW